MKSIKELKSLSGKKIILRVDFNVPIKDGKVVDDFRIKKVIPTILYLQQKGAKVIIISHIGDEGKESLLPVALKLKKYIKEDGTIDPEVLINIGYRIPTQGLNSILHLL